MTDAAKPSRRSGARRAGASEANAEPVRDRGQGTRAGLPALAISAANHQIARASGFLGEAANTIEAVAEGAADALPQPIASAVSNAAGGLRDLAERTQAQDAGRLLQAAQRSAVAHPVATLGIGAAVGALLALALTRVDLGAATT